MNFIVAFIGAITVVAPVLLLRGIAHRRAESGERRQLLESYSQSESTSTKRTDATASLRARLFPTIIDSRYGAWFKAVATRAGTWRPDQINQALGRKFEFLIAALLFGVLVRNTSHGSSTLYLLVLPVFAFFLPDLLLVNKAKKRVARIEQVLPETIDLLNMCANAGLGFQAGMLRVAESQDNPLAEEFNRVLAEMRIGESRSSALRDLADRINLEPLRQFVNSVLQVDRLGVPVTKVLEDQAIKMRAIRKERAREQAQKVPVKILMPIMLFLLPAMMIIVLGPAIISVVRAFS